MAEPWHAVQLAFKTFAACSGTGCAKASTGRKANPKNLICVEYPLAANYIETETMTTQRLVSLDVLRGATIAGMILVNNPGNGAATFDTLQHAAWHGWTFTDTIFPTFLWIAGVSMTFSFARRIEQGGSRRDLLLHTIRRAGLLFLFGLLLNGFPKYDLEHLRIPGVLQRIAVCYLIGAVIFLYTSFRMQVAAIIACLTVYWMAMTLYPVPGYGAGVLEPIGNFSQYVDNMFLAGHMYSRSKVWDPEGIFSTIPAIATILFGVMAGYLLRRHDQTHAQKTAWLATGGGALLFVGSFLSQFMPINKPIWTSSYAVLMAGIASLALACCYWMVDVQRYRKWTKPFVIYGSNAIAAYVLAAMLSRLLTMSGARGPLYDALFVPLGPPKIASLLWAAANVMVCFAACWVMWWRRWFIKL